MVPLHKWSTRANGVIIKISINRLKPFVERCNGESPKRNRVKMEAPSADESDKTDEESCAQLNLLGTDLDDIEHRRWRVMSAAQKLMNVTATSWPSAKYCTQSNTLV